MTIFSEEWWITIVGEIWKHQNMRDFNNGRVDHIEVFTVVQIKI